MMGKKLKWSKELSGCNIVFPCFLGFLFMFFEMFFYSRSGQFSLIFYMFLLLIVSYCNSNSCKTDISIRIMNFLYKKLYRIFVKIHYPCYNPKTFTNPIFYINFWLNLSFIFILKSFYLLLSQISILIRKNCVTFIFFVTLLYSRSNYFTLDITVNQENITVSFKSDTILYYSWNYWHFRLFFSVLVMVIGYSIIVMI